MGESVESGLPSNGPGLMSQAAAGEPAGSPAPAPAPTGDPAPAPAPADGRPAHVPEKFWDPEAKTVRTDAVLKSYTELEKMRAKFGEQAREEVTKELFGKRPESPDKYEIRVPSKAPDGVVIMDKQPGPDFQAEPGKAYSLLNPADPIFEIYRNIAHRAGLSQDEFDENVAHFLASKAIHIPTPEQREEEANKFFQTLGDNGRERVRHVWRGLQQIAGDKAAALDRLVGDKEAFEVVEMLWARASGAPYAPANTGAQPGGVTEASLREIMRSPEYQRGDPETHRKVREGFIALHGSTDIRAQGGIPAPFARR
jgi:hypothetical protein